MKKEYYLTYGKIGFLVERFQKSGKLLYLWKNNTIVTFIDLNWIKLRFSHVISNTVYFRLEDIK